MGEHQVLVTHMEVDKGLLNLFVDLLRDGMLVDAQQVGVRCMDQQSALTEQEYQAKIQADVAASDKSVALITPRYQADLFAMFTLGALWSAGQKIYPLLSPEVACSREQNPQSWRASYTLSKRNHLDALRQELAPESDEHSWNLARDRFLTGADKHFGRVPVAAGRMDLDRLRQLLTEEVGSSIKESGPGWSFVFRGVFMQCWADVAADRMRVFAPVREIAEVQDEQWAAVHTANFKTALDARYATFGDYLVAAFMHDLSSLEDREVRVGLAVVANLVATFGTTYSTGHLSLAAEASF